jgi:hypothetical protein
VKGAPLDEEALAAGLAVLTLGDADGGDRVGNAELVENRRARPHLALAAVDQDDVRPGGKSAASRPSSLAASRQPSP